MELERATLHQRAREIANALGWTYQDEDNYQDNKLCWIATIERKDGLKLIVKDGWHRDDMFTFSPSWPKDARGHQVNPCRYDECRPEINCSMNKTHTQLATDIERRLLPRLAPLYDEALSRISSRNKDYSEKLAAFEMLSALPGAEAYASTDSDRLWVRVDSSKGYVLVDNISGSRASLRTDLPPHVAAKLIRYFAEL